MKNVIGAIDVIAKVADEVRTLATNTLSSSNEIKSMISKLHSGISSASSCFVSIVDKTQKGVEDASNTATIFEEIESHFEGVVRRNSAIRDVVQQGADQANMVKTDLTSVEESVHRNNDNIEQLNGAIVKLKDISDQLHEMVKVFKIY